MKRHPGLVPLSHEHRQVLFIAQVIRRGAVRYRGAPNTTAEKMTYARQSLTALALPHMQREEDILFPAVRGRDDVVDALIAVLIPEHRRITADIATLHDDGVDAATLEERLNALGILIETHVRREERALFQRLQGVLTDEALRELGEQWRAASAGSTCFLEGEA